MNRSSGVPHGHELSARQLRHRHHGQKCAYKFVDFLKAAGQKYWQFLPLGTTSYGDSPYQSFSSFAGNPYYIDLDLLIKDGLLKRSGTMRASTGAATRSMWTMAASSKPVRVLRLAYERGAEKKSPRSLRSSAVRTAGSKTTRSICPSSLTSACSAGPSGRRRISVCTSLRPSRNTRRAAA